tara:strand:- start:327216 stop:327761 length:546 start_codon:yes stop_codon:yes gene_type:complete
MKKSINYLVIVVLAIVSVSCSSEASLQKYYIDSQEDKNFLSIDIPASIISLKDEVSPEAAEAYKSLRKMNLLAFKKNEVNEAEFLIEKKKVSAILKNNKFKELMRMKDKGRDIVIKYEGDDESMDEVIVYASDKTQGFALVRILGDNMKPEKIMKLIGDVQDIDGGSSMVKQLQGFIKSEL